VQLSMLRNVLMRIRSKLNILQSFAENKPFFAELKMFMLLEEDFRFKEQVERELSKLLRQEALAPPASPL
jgi:hypothetical protein